MPTLFIFLLKVNIALIVFCLGYYMVLRRLTFYALNRLYLCIAIVFSSVYPLVNVSSLFRRSPVQAVINWRVPAEKFIQQPHYWYWAELIFWAGAASFAIRLLMQLVSLYKLYKFSKPAKIQGHDVRIIDANISPFSFWQSIYVNPANLAASDLESILQHEQVHVNEWHTLDILLSEISVIFYWFNPGVWLMKKAVRENIEFITDRQILQQGIDSKQYQYSLLNVSLNAAAPAGVVNHFNISTLKKRILMMNAKRSSNINLTRYALLVPAVVVLLLIFSFSKPAPVKTSRINFRSATINTIKNTLINVPQTIKRAAIKKAHRAITVLPLAHSVLISGDESTVQGKVNTEATPPADKVKDALKQLPGIQAAEDGKITAQGQTINQVLVDGKEISSDQVQNAPANEVIKIRITDNKDQSRANSIENLANRMNNNLPANKTITSIRINGRTVYPKQVEISTKNVNDHDGTSFSGKATGSINFIMKTIPVNLPVPKI